MKDIYSVNRYSIGEEVWYHDPYRDGTRQAKIESFDIRDGVPKYVLRFENPDSRLSCQVEERMGRSAKEAYRSSCAFTLAQKRRQLHAFQKEEADLRLKLSLNRKEQKGIKGVIKAMVNALRTRSGEEI